MRIIIGNCIRELIACVGMCISFIKYISFFYYRYIVSKKNYAVQSIISSHGIYVSNAI